MPVSQRKLLTLWQSRYHNSSRTSRSSFCGSYERCRCFCVCSCVRIMCACHPQHMSTRNKFQLALPLNFKNIRAVRTAAAQQQQQRYNTNESRSPHLHRNACVPPFQHPRDLESTTSRREPVRYHISYHSVFKYDTDLYKVVDT